MSFKNIVLTVITVFIAVLLGSFLWLRQELAAAKAPGAEWFKQPAVAPDYAATTREPCRNHNPQRNAYFGALHIHTALSFDARSFGNITGPQEAYHFARGGTLPLRLSSDLPDAKVPEIRLHTPLDFAAVTDHAETLGEVSVCQDSSSPGYGSTLCKIYRGDIELPVGERMQPIVKLASMALLAKQRSAEICGEDGSDCLAAAAEIWQQHQRAAEEAYDRSENCQFTSFVAYEYSLAVESSNLHRNVIFANSSVPPIPLSAKEAPTPDILWRWLKDSCRDAGGECDVLAIPHNSNWSNGRMFFPYSVENRPQDQGLEAATLRAEFEPLVEVMQVKGDSECRNGLSRVMGAADELCDFEKLRAPAQPVEDCGDGFGRFGMRMDGCVSRHSYARYALIQGLEEQRKTGINPFKFGLIAASDTHSSTGGATDEANFMGASGIDRSPSHRIGEPVVVPGVAKGDLSRFNPGGLAGVWAEENSRPSLFAAMQRRETFGTSGPRIVPRLFAGWDLPDNLCNAQTMAEQAYQHGVPMGGNLPAAPDGADSPTLLVSAVGDPASGSASLQKIQIVKGWMDGEGNMQQRIYDVAGNPQPQASVDISSCERSGQGFQQLCASWKDPAFDPASSAVYYARVVENPSCRWSTYDCNSMPESERPSPCNDPNVPKTVQERAWTSPIWYSAEY